MSPSACTLLLMVMMMTCSRVTARAAEGAQEQHVDLPGAVVSPTAAQDKLSSPGSPLSVSPLSAAGGSVAPGVPTSPSTVRAPLPRTPTHVSEQKEELAAEAVTGSAWEDSGCFITLSQPEGYIDSSDPLPVSSGAVAHCTYIVTVYAGYGVELQVKSVNLSDGEQLSIKGVDEGGAWLVLANQTLLVEGQVIRSPSNTLSVSYCSSLEGNVGVFLLHYQIFRLSCSLPKRPHFGEVSVLDLLPGGTARFHCHMGYHLQGEPLLTCVNASRPRWSTKEPACRALCGGTVKNATVGRVLSPSPDRRPNATQDRSCSWSLEAPKDQRLHLHLERLVLGPSDRLVLWSGLDAGSVVLFDSGRSGHVPFEGVISEGPAVRVQFITEQPSQNTGFNIRYEAFERGHCYEPYLQNGNFTTSDPLYGVGAVVQFSCDPGHSLEQGPPVIECISARDPYWNDTEPLCKAQCGGDLSGPGGVILSPNWPEWYGEGEDCSWRLHVGEDKRVLLDIQLLNISDGDVLTVTDGDEGVAQVLGRYPGGGSPFKLFSSTPDLSVTFHSDPAGLVLGKGEGFIINYMVMYCSDPGHVDHSTRSLSDSKLLVGATIRYRCNPGYVLQGGATITCYGREPGTPVWTSHLPHCAAEDLLSCENPGVPDNGYQILSKRVYLPGETLAFVCFHGYQLIGEVAIRCVQGNPSFWSGPLPLCTADHACFSSHALEVAHASSGSVLDGGNVALGVFLLVLLLSVLLGGVYVLVTRCRRPSNLRLPLIYPHRYRQITAEAEFDNPLYEAGGDTREYEVSI
ncbi:seizure 6-like protein isoform X4 [Entelurus aequoreus]|uniref:seizure 6-like protein isoform X4 n=1 Tax=Entelurus aequoreus TaxID=161455 RepID=UPI002B1DAF76|nr:seizure 6-like protein isoform X4 [Entelurus aequoreus]